MMRIKTMPALMLSLLLMACVTINIYFPAAAAEKAADRIIKDVLGTESKNGGGNKSEPNSSSSHGHRLSLLQGLLELTVPSAHAAQANIDISSPAIQKITARMKQRHTQLVAYYNSGAIGFARNALISVRNMGAVPLNQRNLLNKLVADENNDRNALYREIARANGHPEWEQDIRNTFAERWVANAAGGWWYQNAKGQWQQK
jgi:hypothetical protein